MQTSWHASVRATGRLALSIVLLSLALPGFAAQEVLFPGERTDRASSISYNYSVEMLKLAILKSKAQYRLVPVVSATSHDRKLSDMREGKTFDVISAVSSKSLEADLIPIRICLLKGLNGWRIPVVTKQNQEMLAHVETLSDLLKFSAGTGFTWVDTEVLQAAGIKIERTHDSLGLYKMLDAGRFDYLPRGVQDVPSELAVTKHMFGLETVADTHIVIRYPLPFYFFTRRDKPELAENIRQGLEIAVKDGSFDELFYKFYGEVLVNAHLDERKIITLTNPQLTAETPLNRKNLWFSLDDLKRRKK